MPRIYGYGCSIIVNKIIKQNENRGKQKPTKRECIDADWVDDGDCPLWDLVLCRPEQ